MLIQQQAPHFSATACMPDDSFATVQFPAAHKYSILYFWPADFTYVCASETIQFHKQLSEFTNLGAAVFGVSIDTQHAHKAWKNAPKASGGLGTPINHPMVADIDKSISKAYDVLLPNGLAVRGVFIVDTKGVVRAEFKNDLPIGRNIDEIKRTLEALVLVDKGVEVCPANWSSGKPTMKPSTQGVAEYLTKYT